MSKQPSQDAAWLKAESRAARPLVAPLIGLGLAGVACGIGQSAAIAALLAHALIGRPAAIALPLTGFALLALLRAGLAYVAEVAASRAGIAGRRRLRAGPRRGSPGGVANHGAQAAAARRAARHTAPGGNRP